MIVPLEPALEGSAEQRFLNFARQMFAHQAAGKSDEIGNLVETEASLARKLRELEGQHEEYAACVRVLGDLAQLRWQLVESRYGLELRSPRRQGGQSLTPREIQQRKEAIRRELQPRLRQQFADPNVHKFIDRLENPGPSSRHLSIRTLIADGTELQQRLLAAREHRVDNSAHIDSLRQAIRPYLQLVEPRARDTETKITLQDIWRYFRYTWLIPQTPIPGRSLLYLIRDAAHKHHAVIGIAALSNCAVQMVHRDRAIGWSASGLSSALAALLDPSDTPCAGESLMLQGIYQWLLPQFHADGQSTRTQRKALNQVLNWLRTSLTNAIGEIEPQGLVAADDLAAPTPEVVNRLRQLSKEFAAQRQGALARSEEGDAPIAENLVAVPVDDAVLNLETTAQVNESRRMLVRKKRAFELARLLDARRILEEYGKQLTDPRGVLATLEVEEVRTAVNVAMSAIKGRRIGTSLLEITTCGAVAPYNRMLGGKLVALLLLSPQVAADYRQRYGNEPAIIRSQLKNRPEVPDNTLVWLGTTSLFSHGASQYERLRLPAGVIAPDQQEIRYRYLGHTTGYGTIQFADNTVRALEDVMRGRRGYQDVNSVFGEGASPRLRKLRTGLDAIGFTANHIMIHHQERRIYGIPLFPEAAGYLCGLKHNVPNYVLKPETYPDASERIAEFWRQRWLSSRLEHDASWTTLGETRSWLLSDSIPDRLSHEAPQASAGGGRRDDGDGSGGDDAELDFWRRLARADANAVSEGLNESDFDLLHLETPLENILIKHLRMGHSLVLTGNAGDGKTHLARALQRHLAIDVDRIVFEFDATASMTSGHVAPLVKTWRRALKERKALVLAINQYPLHILRRELHKNLPDISAAMERQWSARLCVDPSKARPNTEPLLLIDLSLRNPLSRSFAQRVLKQLLESRAIQRFAKSGTDPDFTFNFDCLKRSSVQGRLFDLFERVVSSGQRATIRELWILCARLLFGAPNGGGASVSSGSQQTWYSERLFKRDARFPLTDALARVGDPAQVSHPQIDLYLEDRRFSDLPPLPRPGGERYQDRFTALKRRFYFEHSHGKQVFALDSSSHGEFHAMLDGNDDDHFLRWLIKAINRCYFPLENIEDKLCLWIGHRLDEQPTKSFVASECIPFNRLGLRRPIPPDPLARAIDHVPDHLLLCPLCKSGTDLQNFSLRIDATLFDTLKSIDSGLPRHLINPGELNHLDSFIDRLRGALEPEALPEFLVYNTEHVTASAIQLSTRRYKRIRRLHQEGWE